MGRVERYPNGSFCWVDLGTNDAPGAKAFYGGCSGGSSTTCRRGAVVSLSRPGESFGAELVNQDATWTWNELVSADLARAPGSTPSCWVSDADDAAATAQRLGGTVLLPPMDIPVGRFTIVADPQGAVFGAAAVPGGPVRGVDGS